MELSQTVGGLIVADGPAPEACPNCGAVIEHEIEQQEGLFIEVYRGCAECQIYWYLHEEPIV